MGKDGRLKLHNKLVGLVGPKVRVYYQPPDGIQLSYPCVIYEFSGITTDWADNLAYKKVRNYSITVITQDPDDELPEKIYEAFSGASYDQTLLNDNLYHHIITVYI